SKGEEKRWGRGRGPVDRSDHGIWRIVGDVRASDDIVVIRSNHIADVDEDVALSKTAVLYGRFQIDENAGGRGTVVDRILSKYFEIVLSILIAEGIDDG